MKKIAIVLILGLTLSSCWDKTENDYNEIYVRLENLSGIHLTNVSIGKRIYKNGGLNFVNYTTRFSELKVNELTKYIDTQGKFNGYASFRGHVDNKPHTWHADERERELQTAGAYDCEWQNPFTENLWDGFCLQEGRYTYKITLREDGRAFLIDIIKE